MWNAGLDSLAELVAEGRKFSKAFGNVGQQVLESTWNSDSSSIRNQIVSRGQSLLRFLYSDYRRAIREFRQALAVELPKGFGDRLSLCEEIISGQAALREIRRGDSLGHAAFGSLWRSEKSNWDQLEAVLNWVTQQQAIGLDDKFRQTFSSVQDQNKVADVLEELSNVASQATSDLRELGTELSLDCQGAFGAADMNGISLKELAERCGIWLSDMEGLSRWNNYFVRARQAKDLKLDQLVSRLEIGTIQ